jgi:hypothetical protein
MAAKRKNPADTTISLREIKMVRFVGYDWVVTNSYKRNGSRFYDLVTATHELIHQKLRRVPTGTIRKYAEASDVKFGEVVENYGT